jgi:hypothetical protein
MRTEFLQYAMLTDEERTQVALPALDASVEEYQLFWGAIETIKSGSEA